jgi:hypothetical protein
MSKFIITTLFLFVGTFTNYIYAQNEHIFLVKMSSCASGPKERSQTGFRIRGIKGVITALHGVAGCGEIKVQSETGKILSDAVRVSRVDVKNDVALLSSSELESAGTEGLAIAPTTVQFTPEQKVVVVGHPFGISSIRTSLELRTPPTKRLREIVPPGDILRSLDNRASPAIQTTIVFMQGTILPGHSGAPVFDSNLNVIAVANGGLGGGMSEIVWAIPVSNIQWENINENQSVRDRISQLGSDPSASLFSFDSNIPPIFPIVKRDTRTFPLGIMETDITVTPQKCPSATTDDKGCLEAVTHTRGTNNLDGFCGNITVWFFDKAGNKLDVYGMGQDHQWCVGSGVEALFGGGQRTRQDRQTIEIPREILGRTDSVSILHLEGPGKNPRELIEAFLNQSPKKQTVSK